MTAVRRLILPGYAALALLYLLVPIVVVILFSFNDPNPPIISRFIEEQRFDLQATISPDSGQTITGAQFLVDGVTVPGAVSLTPATVAGKPTGDRPDTCC